MFIFNLESTFSSSCWTVVSVEKVSRFPITFVEEKFQMLPPELLLSASKGVLQKDFYIFLALFSKFFNGLFFYLAKATRCLLNFFPSKFLSCCCNK